MGSSFSSIDFLYTPILIVFIFIIGFFVQRKKRENNPLYKFYLSGLMVKVFASILFLIVYTFYYRGGDTIEYINGSYSMSGLLLKDIGKYFQTITGTVSKRSWNDAYYFLDPFPPYYMWKDANCRAVINLTSFINVLGFRSPLPTTILMAAFSYLGVWKLFLFFTNFYPHLEKRFAIAVLFLPSLVFWGSGVMKDTYTFAASGWLVYNIFMIFVKKKKLVVNIMLAIINAFIIIKIKPYIFVALLPGTIIWLFFNPISRIKNRVLALTLVPAIIVFSVTMIVVVFSSMGGLLGKYNSIDSVIEKAKVTQEDLTRSDQYGSNSYNIGKIDGTTTGMLKVAPAAIIAGMYRPFLWEAKNPVMLISGLENFFLLIITFFLLIRLKIFRFFQFLFSDPILIFSFLFVIIFMFSVGLASANFGALVRYKIPALPFLVAMVFIMLDKYTNYKKRVNETKDKK